MRKIAALVCTVAVGAALSGCSALPGGELQTRVQACSEFQHASISLTQGMKDMYTNPEGAASSVDQFVSEMEKGRAKVTDPKVVAAFDKNISSAKEISSLLRSSNGKFSKLDTAKLTDALNDSSNALLDLSKACTG